MSDRVFVFIDGSNLDMAVLKYFDRRVNPEPLVNKLVGNRRLMRVNYYESPLLQDVNRKSFDNQQAFFERLRKNSFFSVRLGRRVRRDVEPVCTHCGQSFKKTTWIQKGVDSLITFDLVTLAARNAYDIAILVAGDQDFVCPVLEVRMMNKLVENAFTSYAWSSNLKAVADFTTLIDQDFLKGCWQT